MPYPAYQDIHHPSLPSLRPLLQRTDFPTDNTALPIPQSPYAIQGIKLLGLPLHHNDSIRNNPDKYFTRWLDWHLEVNDSLFRQICPADLNDLPCPCDELHGGCAMLRLCVTKRKYQHRYLWGFPECTEETRGDCPFIHDVETTCWSLHEQLVRAPSRQFRSYQSCPVVARQRNRNLADQLSYCPYGHDLESTRVETWWGYWEHRAQAMRMGARVVVTRDRFGNNIKRPLRPKRQTLEGTSCARELDGSLTGKTWHGAWVTMTCMVGSDRPVDDGRNGGNRMLVDLRRREMRPVIKRSGRTPDVYLEQQQETAARDAREDAYSIGGWSPSEPRRCMSI